MPTYGSLSGRGTSAPSEWPTIRSELAEPVPRVGRYGQVSSADRRKTYFQERELTSMQRIVGPRLRAPLPACHPARLVLRSEYERYEHLGVLPVRLVRSTEITNTLQFLNLRRG